MVLCMRHITMPFVFLFIFGILYIFVCKVYILFCETVAHFFTLSQQKTKQYEQK